MLFNMMRFEWRYFTQQPSFIVTSLIFFLLPFLAVTIENVQIGSSSNVNINSPHAIAQALLIFAVFGMFLVVNFVANTAMRNDLSTMNEIVISKPLSTFQYQLGRFLGAYLVCLTVFAMIPLALLIGSIMPWLDQERLGPVILSHYIVPYVVFSMTTLFVLSSIFYAAALRFKSMMAVYLLALGIFMLYAISGQIFTEPDQRQWLAILDPFGLNVYGDVVRYWTPIERNTQVISLDQTVLLNRGLWIGIGLLVMFGLGRFFSPLGLQAPSASKRTQGSIDPAMLNNKIDSSYSNDHPSLAFITRVKFEMKQVFLSPAFGILMVFCVFSLISQLVDPPNIYGAANWPLTQYMVEMIQNAFGLSLIIVITYYTAEVVWRERTVGMGDIIDSMPVSNFTFWFSKFIAVSLVVVAVQLAGMSATLLYQLSTGFLQFNISQYLISLFYFQALPWILLVVLAFLIQALSPGKYVGMLIFVGFFFVSLAFSELGLEHNMFNYSASPFMQYSDMNGYGWFLVTQNYYMLYWGALAVVFSAISYACWQRGPESSLKTRLSMLSYHLGSAGRTLVILGTVLFIGMGTVIHYNTTVTNEFVTNEEGLQLRTEYEKQYAQYEDAPLPMITAMNIDAAIFPQQRKIEIMADMTLVNKTEKNIDRFLVNLPRFSSDIILQIGQGKLESVNEDFNNAWYILDEALAPGQTVDGKIRLVRQHFGFKDRGEDTTLVKNGTFINNFELLPTFGVNTSLYLSDKHERRKRDLPPPKRAYDLEDSSRYNESFFGPNVGLIDFSATLSTSEDQIAIAPGYLEKYWTEGERNYFRYEMDSPMINFFNIMSGDLEVKSEIHKGVDITVYYHRDHAWNVDRMIESTKDSLDLFTEAFGPYQHKQLRIIEFPGYRRFAQSFANTVPYSERIGFISDLRDKNEIDPVYYITAHEVAHQWFGHQLNAANVQGSAIISEALSQYASLQVMQKKYGEDKIRKFLSFELDSYLRGRTQENIGEMPLMRSENQQYIHYRKGSVVMMAIADRIGMDALNTALAELIARFKFSETQQATTLDLLAAIKKHADESHHAFIEQQFAQITLYDLRLEEAEISEQAGEYEVTLAIETAQFNASADGEENQEDFEDYVDIVLFAEDPDDFAIDNEILYRQKHLLTQGSNTLSITLDSKPKYAAVDPFIRYIDRETRDNVRMLKD